MQKTVGKSLMLTGVTEATDGGHRSRDQSYEPRSLRANSGSGGDRDLGKRAAGGAVWEVLSATRLKNRRRLSLQEHRSHARHFHVQTCASFCVSLLVTDTIICPFHSFPFFLQIQRTTAFLLGSPPLQAHVSSLDCCDNFCIYHPALASAPASRQLNTLSLSSLQPVEGIMPFPINSSSVSNCGSQD